MDIIVIEWGDISHPLVVSKKFHVLAEEDV
jgi:hypothetical protein